ncbi:MAG: hypothetical protein M1828_004357 [Chrysothrix sp. TS-e1954]|nr:MAG: hypothetical protein M1828_004357 [Chrysothrix sp. TS-e1954]
MASTPSPPRRPARTPSTPLHGSKHDAYEPYSPRRSSRISAMQDIQTAHSGLAGLSSVKPSKIRQVDHSLHAAVSRPQRSAIRRTSSQTYSPPDSPIRDVSLNEQLLDAGKSTNGVAHTRAIMSPKEQGDFDPKADDSNVEPLHKMRRLSKQVGTAANALPTPSKTPRKHKANASPRVQSTARVLFAGTTNEIPENTMPSRAGHKIRMSRMSNVSKTLDDIENGDFGEGGERAGIDIYTDAAERVPEPEADETEDNPFVIKQGRKHRRVRENEADHQDVTNRRNKRSKMGKHGMGDEIDKAVANNEGMVYVFRGKKVFRKFSDMSSNAATSSAPIADTVIDPAQQAEIERRIGDAAQRPLPRSRVKPKKLFEEELKASELEEEAPTEVDEEAPTDIEERLPETASEVSATPRKIKQGWRPVTPPTTGRRERKIAQTVVDVPMSMESQLDGTFSAPEAEEPSNSQGSQTRRSPFDSWTRLKSASSEVSFTGKRSGDPVEKVDAKRTRAGRGKLHAASD